MYANIEPALIAIQQQFANHVPFSVTQVFPNSEQATIADYVEHLEYLLGGAQYVLTPCYFPAGKIPIFAVLFHKYTHDIIKYQVFDIKPGIVSFARQAIPELNKIMSLLEKPTQSRRDLLVIEQQMVPYAQIKYLVLSFQNEDVKWDSLINVLQQIPQLLFPSVCIPMQGPASPPRIAPPVIVPPAPRKLASYRALFAGAKPMASIPE